MERCALVTALLVALIIPAAWCGLRLVPLPSALFQPQARAIEFRDRHQAPLRSEAGTNAVNAARVFQDPVRLPDVPASLVQATLAAEDKRFWEHPGVDWRATTRACWQLVRHGRAVSGASTITQQLIKLAQPRPRTLRAKLVEAVQALRLEQVWSKRQILEHYLNRLEYGYETRGCVAAAELFFRKPIRDLSVAEAALLAGLPQAPTRLNPHRHFEQSRKRQQWILGQMHRAGWLDADELARARAEQLRLPAPRRAFEASHFVDLARKELSGASGPVTLTLDLELNRVAERILRRQLASLRGSHVHDGSIVVIENRTGDVLCLVGSPDFFDPGDGQVNGAWSPRSAGSTFKPFTYLLAFEKGTSPATVVADIPAEFPTATGVFAPVNYNRQCYGPMRYRLALANSLNISAVNVLDSIGGPEPLLARLRMCGLSTLNRAPDYYGLGLTIGNAEARLLELTSAYSCIANLGIRRPYRLLRDSRAAGETVVADPAACYLIADILSDNTARTLAFGPESALRFAFPVACKTGTSSDFRDNWAFGFTPEFTVGVWVGNFDGSPMDGVSGVSGAAPVMHALVKYLYDRFGTSWYAPPAKVREGWVNAITGRLCQDPARSEPCRKAIREKFVFAPPEEKPSDYSADGRVWVGPEYQAWLATSENRLAAVLAARQNGDSLKITFPPPGTIVELDPDLPGNGGTLRLQAHGAEVINWRSPSLPIVSRGHKDVALLSAGTHRLIATDVRRGLQAETWIEVRSR